jgi:hypothetical protein
MNKIDLIIDALKVGLKLSDGFISEWNQINKALAAARELQALKPVAYIDHVSGKPKFINGYVVQTDYDIPLYTAPPRKPWVGLNWDDIPDVFVGDIAFLQGAKWALAKLKEKNI